MAQEAQKIDATYQAEIDTWKSFLSNLTTPIPTDGMTNEMIISIGKSVKDEQKRLSDIERAKYFAKYRKATCNAKNTKETFKTFAETIVPLVESEIGIKRDWSKGSSIKLANGDRLSFAIKFLNPNPDDEALEQRKKALQAIETKLEDMVSTKLKTKELIEYLVYKRQDGTTKTVGIFDDLLTVGDYKVQVNVGLTKKGEEEEVE